MSRQPLIVLTCMRSFSSVVSAMLGQHPGLYNLPELNIFCAPRLGKMVGMSMMFRPTSLSGMLRTVAQLEFGGQGEREVKFAREWINERLAWSGQRFFTWVMDKVSPALCLEKSPSTGMKIEHLQRLGDMFPEAPVLHLTRHPRSACKSIHTIMSRTDQATGLGRADKTDQEELWLRINTNILAYTDTLAPGQSMRLRGEDFLGRPEVYIPQITQWLGLDYNQEIFDGMLHPENSPYAFIGPKGAPFGNDPNFLRHPEYRKRDIPVLRLDGPQEWREDGREFSGETRRVAQRLGYI